MPATIISKKPLDPNEPSIVEPSLPYYKKSMEILPAQPKAGTGKNNSDFPITSIGETGDKLWNYIQSHLV